MNNSLMISLLTIAAFALTWMTYPLALRFAKRYNIVDNPDARKLQREPVPVLGGVAVALSMLPMICVCFSLLDGWSFWALMVALVVMLIVGVLDDIENLQPSLRFIIEIAVMGCLVGLTHSTVSRMQGLFGVEALSPFSAIPFSIFVGVGIVNAINLIDGVDGYSSGFSMVALALFAAAFFWSGDILMGTVCLIGIGSILPFFFHNTLIARGKMYIGDGGTMLIGTLLSYCVMALLDTESLCTRMSEVGISQAAFAMAVLCVPVFDTLRVMCRRIACGHSPFMPDRTHLHHLYIELGFSHLMTTVTIIFTNCLIVAIWFACWYLGVSPVWQLVIVCILGILATFVYYPLMHRLVKQ